MNVNTRPLRHIFFNYIKNSRKGAVTIEYALIFPIVILCVFILMFIGLVFYQQALLQSVVSENVQNCAFLWGYDFNSLKMNEGITGKKSYLSEDLYWQIFSKADRKKSILRENIMHEIKKRSILKPSGDVNVEIVYHNYFLVQKVGFKAEMAYKMPCEGFLDPLDCPVMLKFTATVK